MTKKTRQDRDNEELEGARSQDLYEKLRIGYKTGMVTHEMDFDLENDAFDVRITLNTGEEYSMNFVTPRFLTKRLETYRQTGECTGVYFAMPRMIVVERVDGSTIRKTIEDLITKEEIEDYLEKIN